ncbi:unnamed protein product [Rangifer tarandus platyrhynchus]|uniref:Uncharacterized protein n=2 Tax=Rangifer tarandus platyrhynchus TaxID=3082113 RepID=A0ABN8ZLP3_RANTA|nr:unnamed protein product [Rangifer tarandus platyrhynchus]
MLRRMDISKEEEKKVFLLMKTTPEKALGHLLEQGCLTHGRSRSPALPMGRGIGPAPSVPSSAGKPQLRIAGVPEGRGRRAPAGPSFVPARLRQPRSSAAGGAAARRPVHQHHLGAIRLAGVAPA